MKLKLKIFHIEDDRDYADLLTKQLEHFATKYGIDIDLYTFTDSAQLFTFIKQNQALKCNLIISDYTLPNTSGIELIRQVKNIFPDVVSVLLTSKGDLKVIPTLIDHEVDFYLHKSSPISFVAYMLVNILKLLKQIQSLQQQQQLKKEHSSYEYNDQSINLKMLNK